MALSPVTLSTLGSAWPGSDTRGEDGPQAAVGRGKHVDAAATLELRALALAIAPLWAPICSLVKMGCSTGTVT